MSKLRYGQFKKKDYNRILNVVVDFCLEKFGYKIRPYIREAKLDDGEMMLFCDSNKHYAIFYDWQQFKKLFGKSSYATQEVYAMATAAHEMRHYYQVRQIYAKVPHESKETIAQWRDNHFTGKVLGENGCTLLEFFMQPMELDAELYGYYFAAKMLDRSIDVSNINNGYLDVLKSKFIEIYGEDHEDLYIFDVKSN